MLTFFMVSILALLVLLATCSGTAKKHRYLSVFSIQNSMKSLSYNSESPLNTFNGIRSLAMMWVIFGHEYSLVLGFTSNILSLNNKFGSWFFLIIEAALFSVDTFFFVGGFLVAYVFLREKSQSFLKYPLAILNRYLRIVPAYLLAMLIYYSVFPHLGSGPLWRP